MVVFENTAAIKNDFRKFKIRTVEGADDFASMQEVIYRRFKRFLDGDKAFSKLPDIIFMDGGKPQITAAEQVLAAMKLDIPVAGMVKDDNHRTRGLIWKEKEYKLSEYPILFKYVTAIQDKVHEFAIDYHTGIRNKNALGFAERIQYFLAACVFFAVADVFKNTFFKELVFLECKADDVQKVACFNVADIDAADTD